MDKELILLSVDFEKVIQEKCDNDKNFFERCKTDSKFKKKYKVGLVKNFKPTYCILP